MNQLPGVPIEGAKPDMVERKLAAPLERRRLRAYILMLLLDAVVIHGAFMLASRVYHGRWWEPEIMLAAQALLPL